MGEKTICSVDEIPEGKGVEAEVDGIRVAVFRVNSDFYAVQGLCPHKSAPLSAVGKEKIRSELCSVRGGERGDIDEEEKSINCPWHEWTFDLETGEYVGVDGEDKDRLRTFETVVEGDELKVVV